MVENEGRKEENFDEFKEKNKIEKKESLKIDLEENQNVEKSDSESLEKNENKIENNYVNENVEEKNEESKYEIIKFKKSVRVDFEQSYEKYIENEEKSEPVGKEQMNSLYTFCSMCGDYIFVQYRKSIVESATSYPVHICFIHGNPIHGILVRIDKNYVSRGEKAVELEFDINLYKNQFE